MHSKTKRHSQYILQYILHSQKFITAFENENFFSRNRMLVFENK